jgi:predicted GNAT family acetyltransferase
MVHPSPTDCSTRVAQAGAISTNGDDSGGNFAQFALLFKLDSAYGLLLWVNAGSFLDVKAKDAPPTGAAQDSLPTPDPKGGTKAKALVDRIVDERDNGRYVAYTKDGQEMGWLGYRIDKGVKVLYTTQTDPKFRGQGVADQMTRKAIDDAVAAKELIDPECWYASEWVNRNPKYSKYVTDPGF